MKFDRQFWIGFLFWVGVPCLLVFWWAWYAETHGLAVDYSKPYRQRGETVHDTIYVHDTVGLSLEQMKNSGLPIPSKLETKLIVEKECSSTFSKEALRDQARYPMYSYCMKCGEPWNLVKSYYVMYGEVDSILGKPTRGMFCTCVDCWLKCSLEELKRFYSLTYNRNVAEMRQYDKYAHEDVTLEELLDAVEKEYNKTHNNETK